jgi:hypothetical protein
MNPCQRVPGVASEASDASFYISLILQGSEVGSAVVFHPPGNSADQQFGRIAPMVQKLRLFLNLATSRKFEQCSVWGENFDEKRRLK